MTYQLILENIHGYLINQLDGSSLSVEHFYASLESSIQQTRDQGFIPFLVMTDLIEGRMYDKEINHKFDEFRKLMSTKKIEYIFVCDAGCKEHSELIDKGDVLYSNFLLLSSYTRSILEKNQEVNDHWNHTSNKGLWTPGKMDRPHRALLMKRLWEDGLLDSIEYSCYLSNSDYIHKTFFSNYDNEKFGRFSRETSKHLDLINVENFSQIEMFNGYPYDVNIYKNTSFSIITESDFCTRLGWTPKITEKTYRAIANNHPIISVWFPGMLHKLHGYGFKTFEEYMLVPEYNDILDLDERIEASLKNILHFQTILQDKHIVEKIKNDVAHNITTLVQLAHKEIEILSPIFERDQNPNLKFDPITMSYFLFPNRPSFLSNHSN